MIEGPHCGDNIEAHDRIAPGTVDAIITDPPYIKAEWEAAYRDLGGLAATLLKPGGFLITYSGHFSLPGAMRILGDAGLTYYWILCQVNNHSRTMIYARNMVAAWKPILIYSKPPVRRQKMIGNDMITVGEMEKRYHGWQQSIKEALYLVEMFTAPGDLVMDPFMGSGTIPLACKLKGRRWIGWEINPDTFKVATSRLTQSALVPDEPVNQPLPTDAGEPDYIPPGGQ